MVSVDDETAGMITEHATQVDLELYGNSISFTQQFHEWTYLQQSHSNHKVITRKPVVPVNVKLCEEVNGPGIVGLQPVQHSMQDKT